MTATSNLHLATEAFGPGGEILSLYICPFGGSAVLVTDGVEREIDRGEEDEFLWKHGVDNPWTDWSTEPAPDEPVTGDTDWWKNPTT